MATNNPARDMKEQNRISPQFVGVLNASARVVFILVSTFRMIFERLLYAMVSVFVYFESNPECLGAGYTVRPELSIECDDEPHIAR